MTVQQYLSLNSLPEYSNIFDCASHVGHHVGSLSLSFFFSLKLLSCVQLFAAPWTVACQAALSMEFSRQEYWSGKLFPSPGDLPNPGIKPRQNFYHLSHQGSPKEVKNGTSSGINEKC